MLSRSTTWAFEADKVNEFAYMNNAFSKEECLKIIELGESLEMQIGTTVSNSVARNSQISWIFPTEESAWIFRRVIDICMSLNNQFFKFDLFGLVEGFQFTKYSDPDGFYGAHIDKVYDNIVRKLSITIQLSDPNDYEGGELELHIKSDPLVMQKDLGYLVVFPSYTLHQVKPVTKGTRYSLVAWVTGTPFK